MIKFTTKANTLVALQPYLTTAQILPLVVFSVKEFYEDETQVFELLKKQGLLSQCLIVRSSAENEDTTYGSNAGKYLSIGNVCGKDAILHAIKQVAQAMGEDGQNQIFIQPYLENVDLCGVAFTADPNTGGNYYVLNYDTKTGSTSSVTDGTGTQLNVYYHFKSSPVIPPAPLDRIITLCKELEQLFQLETLDIEFAFANQILYLFQVRPLLLRKPLASLAQQKEALAQVDKKIKCSMFPHPELYGKRTIYGIMPDWNPAEMIGIRPKPLALSMYREIITDGVWAYQRDNYGYRNLRSFPLMVDFQGCPYIDTRISFNSFLPKQISRELGEKLIDYYLDQLYQHPEYHDKIEFEIAFTSYTFDLPQRIAVLRMHGFTKEEQDTLLSSLRTLTNSIINKDGLWKKDAKKIEILKEKHQSILKSNMDIQGKVYWLLEYLKRYGTLPFAGLARAGFIAVELLRSMVSTKLLTEEERQIYMSELSTVGKNMARDRSALSTQSFFQKYGHLRPGTYDICSPRYDQDQDMYFGNIMPTNVMAHEPFKLTLSQFHKIQQALDAHGLDTDVLSLFDFIKGAIEGREYAKFIFTQTLSDVLELVAQLGKQYGLSKENMSYINIRQIMNTYPSACNLEQVIRTSIHTGKIQDAMMTSLVFPPLLWHPEQIYSFSLPDEMPNFITQHSCTAEVITLPTQESIKGKLVLIEGADPGYDWIFSHEIAGFITAYGGANSHMAIRAEEFGLPAVIGVGEKQFLRYTQAKKLHVDCRNKMVTIL